MKGNAVHGGRHAMFAYTIMDISAAVIVAVKNTVAANLVLFDPVRSAEPPNKVGQAGKIASSVFWLATRVASFVGQPPVWFSNQGWLGQTHLAHRRAWPHQTLPLWM